MIALLGELGLVTTAAVVAFDLPVGGGGARRYVVIAVLGAGLGLQNATVRRLAVADGRRASARGRGVAGRAGRGGGPVRPVGAGRGAVGERVLGGAVASAYWATPSSTPPRSTTWRPATRRGHR
jgi:hypothetical protein